MDNLKTHSECADQPQGPQVNALSFALPAGQVLDSHMVSQQRTNPSSFWFSLEQHRLQLDQVLQLHNEQLWVSLQQQISTQNTTLLNLVESVTRDALIQKHGEIASLQAELQKKQEDLETTLHNRDEWMNVAMAAYEINQTLIHMIRAVPLEANSHVSSNDLGAPSYRGEASSIPAAVEATQPNLICKVNDLGAPSTRGEASSMARAAETTQPNLICKVCNSGNACMLVLPCQHLSACKPCVAWLPTCPICGALKTDAIEARFV